MTIAPNAPGAWEGTGAIGVGLSADQSLSRCAVAARAASSKLGRDIVVLGVEKLLGLTDAFVITSGANARQVRTINDEVERQLKLAGNGGPMRLRASTTPVGYSWTTATSSSTCSWKRRAAFTTWSTSGVMPPPGRGTSERTISSAPVRARWLLVSGAARLAGARGEGQPWHPQALTPKRTMRA